MLRNWLKLNITRAPDDGAGGGGAAPADDKAAPAAAATDPAAAAPASGDTPPAAAPAAGVQGDPAAAAPAPADNKPAVAPTDPAAAPAADWTRERDALIAAVPADLRDKTSKVLSKYASKDAMVLALAAADSKISELGEKAKGLVKVPGKDAKAEDVSAFDRAWGVPEKADAYEFKRPEGFEVTELDKAFDNKAKEVFKNHHLNQDQVNAIVELDLMRETMAREEINTRIKQSGEKAANELRVAWGVNEYGPQVEAIQRYVDEVFKPMAGDKANSFLDKRFADGSCLGEDVDFLKFMAQHVVNPWMDDNGIPRGGVPGGNASEDAARERTIMGLMHSDPKLYATKAIQDELDGILARKTARGKKVA